MWLQALTPILYNIAPVRSYNVLIKINLRFYREAGRGRGAGGQGGRGEKKLMLKWLRL
jgi:hypothetical protein